MCGRYTVIYKEDFAERYGLDEVDVQLDDRYNMAPMQEAPVIIKDGKVQSKTMRWGLVPFWAKDESIGSRMINARGETVAEKPSYRKPFKSQRCLVPASGFYEWQKTKDGKQPFYMHMKDDRMFSFAGLYDVWTMPNGKKLYTYTIITTEPNSLMANIHDRMPVILEKGSEKVWLDEDAEKNELLGLLDAYSADELEAYMVSTLVNSPGNEGEELLQLLKTK